MAVMLVQAGTTEPVAHRPWYLQRGGRIGMRLDEIDAAQGGVLAPMVRLLSPNTQTPVRAWPSQKFLSSTTLAARSHSQI